MFGEALANRKPDSQGPVYMTDIEFAHVIQAAEIKIYAGAPIVD